MTHAPRRAPLRSFCGSPVAPATSRRRISERHYEHIQPALVVDEARDDRAMPHFVPAGASTLAGDQERDTLLLGEAHDRRRDIRPLEFDDLGPEVLCHLYVVDEPSLHGRVDLVRLLLGRLDVHAVPVGVEATSDATGFAQQRRGTRRITGHRDENAIGGFRCGALRRWRFALALHYVLARAIDGARHLAKRELA